MMDTFSLFDLQAGRVLAERFEIVGPSRQGGLSAAFEVLDLELGQHRELQVFPATLFDGDAEAEDFAAGWQAWRAVGSDVVAEFHGVVRIGKGTLALVTGLPPGISLRKALTDGREFTSPEVCDLGLALCQGLAAIHDTGLVHGDVKPNTIFINGHENPPCLVDGGVTSALWTAKHVGEHTQLIGTPLYAPPEQFGGDAPDVLSDVYNLAALLYELACGVLPWGGRSFLEVFQAKLEKTPPSMAERAATAPGSRVAPRALEEAIVGGLYASRKERYPSAEVFHAALAEVRADLA